MAALAVLLVSCGSESGTPESKRADAADGGQWRSQRLDAEPGADRELQLTTWDDEVLFINVTEEDELQSWHGSTDDTLSEGTVLDTGVAFLSLGGTAKVGTQWLTLGTGGATEIDGDQELLWEAHAFRSDDGLAWKPVDLTGFTGALEITDLVAAGDRWVAVGMPMSEESETSEPPGARAWWSTDGEVWTETLLPSAGTESSVLNIADVRGQLLAVGRDGEQPAVWSSADGGETWTQVDTEGLTLAAGLTSLASDGTTAFVGALPTPTAESDESERIGLFFRSDDAGASWRAIDDPPPTDDSEGWAPVYGGTGGRYFVSTSSYLTAWEHPEVCYADIDRCNQDSVVAFYSSTDGDRWQRVDTAGIGEGEASEVQAATDAEDGTVITVTWDDGLVLSSWPGGVDLPAMDEPVLPTADITLLDEGDDPEVGVRYAVPLHIHCGMDWLWLGDQPLQRTDDGPDVETGAGDPANPRWPMAQQTIFGFATLQQDGTVSYDIGEGDVIATYAPSSEEPAVCI